MQATELTRPRLLGLLIILLISSGLEAATIHVPGDSATIQLGIMGAVNGDTVLVAPGEYPDSNIALQGRDIVVLSEDGPEATIIHGSFLFIPSDTSEPIIDGFTIRDHGSNIVCFFANPVIRNCIISHGDSTDIGGAVMAASSSPRFENCTFSYNRATDAGSAIFAVRTDPEAPRCSVEVVDCRFLYNYATGPPAYGGIDIHATQGAEIYVSNSLFVGDTTSGAPCAYEWNSLVQFNNCTFSGYQHVIFEIENDSGETMIESPRLEVNHCAISYDISLAFQLTEFPDSVSIIQSVLYGWGPVVPESTITVDDLQYMRANPLFCDTAALDYRVSDTSPCLAENNAWGADIGAFGMGCSLPYICGDADGDGAVSMSDIVFLVNFIFLPDAEYPSPPAAGDPDCSGSINMSDVIYIVQYIFAYGPPPCDTDNDGEPDC